MMWYIVGEGTETSSGRIGVTTVLGLTDPRDTLKMLRETLCLAQDGLPILGEYIDDEDGVPSHSERLGRIIAEIDRQRPIGPDGKHGDRHTETCQCDGKSGWPADGQ